MTGLDLESFLLLLRADLTTWVVLGLATLVLALMVWSCWRSRRALRNCLVLSLAAHLGIVLYGSTIPAVCGPSGPDHRDTSNREHVRQIRVAPLTESGSSNRGPSRGDSGPRDPSKRWDVTTAPLALADGSLKVARPEIDDRSRPIVEPKSKLAPLAAEANVTPRGKGLTPAATALIPPPEPTEKENISAGPTAPSPANLAEIDQVDFPPISEAAPAVKKPVTQSSLLLDPALAIDRRLRPIVICPANRRRLKRNLRSRVKPSVTSYGPEMAARLLCEGPRREKRGGPRSLWTG